ncbi:hypothetical protein [Kordiimonas sediminis]|uniref:hypothetical protein n=1 Tax=Kordiimonas sediminis TaxID=1735581 RepID=UPI00174E26D0|nr:hypothetical protein [Kordiimonas sediminis]
MHDYKAFIYPRAYRDQHIAKMIFCSVILLALLASAGTYPANAATAKNRVAAPNLGHAPITQAPMLFTDASDEAPRATARSFVLSAGLYRGMSLMILDDLKVHPAITNYVSRHGMNRVQPIVVQHIKRAVAAHTFEWADMLADLLAEEFSTEELRSIRDQQTASPYFGAFVAKQSALQTRIRERGQSILQTATDEVLADVSASFSSVSNAQTSRSALSD